MSPDANCLPVAVVASRRMGSLRWLVVLAVVSTAAVLVASATAACPTLVRWHGTMWQLDMLNNGQPRPAHGPLLGRTRVLDLECVPIPGFKSQPVSVYALPKIDPHVAFYQE